jgi:tetratricopeptide (TPR) repeat protein
MSLLMEALKRAEESQRQGNDTASVEDAPLELEPLAPPSQAPKPAAPKLSAASPATPAPGTEPDALSFSAFPEQTRVEKRAARPREAGVAAAPDRALAKRLLAPKNSRGPSLAFWITLAVLLAMASIAAFHFWRQYTLIASNSARSQTRLVAPNTARQSPPPPPLSTPTLSTPPPVAAPLSAPPPAPTPLATPPARQAPSAPADALPQPPSPPQTPLTPRASSPARASLLSPPAARSSEHSVRSSRDTARVDPRLENAYALLLSGRFDAALPLYEAALRDGPENIDAVLGLATIAAKSGQSARAYAYYRRALEIDPRDPTALAGLINERGLSDAPIAESRLKNALAAQPASPVLFFSLGNLYAGQSRWSEAQQAYFSAYSTDPSNADYAFNLAVSLDHLNQTNLALRYYRAALKSSRDAPNAPSFDVAQVKNRILELSPSSDPSDLPDRRALPQ